MANTHDPRPKDVEEWTLQIIDRLSAGAPIEDDRVELKSEWPEGNKGARRLAAHANTAHGERILWLIGIDEKRASIVGADATDLATWWPQIGAEFEEVSPDLLAHINVPRGGKTVVALVFDTERAPYVVRNEVHGHAGGGPVALEVPWRHGTSVRSAKRSDLLRILVPRSRLPDLEVLDGALHVSVDTMGEEKYLTFHLGVTIYITPRGDDRIVIPAHRCSLHIALPEVGEIKFVSDDVVVDAAETGGLIASTGAGLIVDGPGRIGIRSARSARMPMYPAAGPAIVTMGLRPSGVESSTTVDATFSLGSVGGDASEWGRWAYERP